MFVHDLAQIALASQERHVNIPSGVRSAVRSGGGTLLRSRQFTETAMFELKPLPPQIETSR
ncbi:MAG TPA: hypothetical protein VE690_00800, partial [Rhodopila sp.]|nr:hypothetical protein [Rhodopila sp.]